MWSNGCRWGQIYLGNDIIGVQIAISNGRAYVFEGNKVGYGRRSWLNQDGSITLCQYLEQKGDWQETKISAHDGAVSALSWAPATEPHLLKAESVDMTAEE